MTRIELQVRGLHCSGCERSLVAAVRRLDGVVTGSCDRCSGERSRALDAVGGEAFRHGVPIRLEPRATWEADRSHTGFVAWLQAGPRRSLRLAVANLGPTTGRCFIPLSLPEFAGRTITLEDLLGDARYTRDGRELLDRGLYLELPPDGHHLFRIRGHLSRDPE